MNYEEINEKLKILNTKDYIWLIYIGIIFMSWYSNSLERKYFTENDIESKTKYQKIMVLIFTILIVIYLYFLKESINDIKNLKPWDTPKKKNLVYLSFLGSLLIAISGFIFLYISIVDENLDIELAFN
ncbi:MAG: hypothetical protein UFD82_00765 [Bacilli bacterium]|nr:hypothetical protein [Bacilli bacterium]